MRCLGEIDGRQNAERLVAHLLTLEVSTHIETADAQSDNWEIWVREEDKLDLAVSELRQFQANPNDARYAESLSKAREILQLQEEKRAQAAKNIKTIKTVVRPGMASGGRLPPLTLTILILCIALGLFSEFSHPGPNNGWGLAITQQLSFVNPVDFVESKGNPGASLLKGQLWRAITPAFMHHDPIHLAMNMFGLVIFGRVLERLFGTPRYAVFILLAALLANLLQGLMPPSLHGSANFVGFSGVIYAFLGYVWVRSTLNPMFGISIPAPFIVLAVGSIVVGLSGAVPGWQLADLCHLGGLMVGAALGFASARNAGE